MERFNKIRLTNEETNAQDVDLSSFELRDELCPEFWGEGKLNKYIRRILLTIARDVIEDIDIEGISFEDIVITGSIANYNWNEEYSDIDLHIVMNFDSVNDDTDLVKKYFDAYRKNWNNSHSQISIAGYPVEIYLQDTSEPHSSTGIYSLMNDEWVVEPDRDILASSEYDEDFIQKTVADYMNDIDDLEIRLNDGDNPMSVRNDAGKVFKSIKDQRKMLSSKSEMNDGNLIFKTLRRNGYIEKLLVLRTKCYDMSKSYNNNEYQD